MIAFATRKEESADDREEYYLTPQDRPLTHPLGMSSGALSTHNLAKATEKKTKKQTDTNNEKGSPEGYTRPTNKTRKKNKQINKKNKQTRTTNKNTKKSAPWPRAAH